MVIDLFHLYRTYVESELAKALVKETMRPVSCHCNCKFDYSVLLLIFELTDARVTLNELFPFNASSKDSPFSELKPFPIVLSCAAIYECV